MGNRCDLTQKSDGETVTVCGIEMPITVACDIHCEHKHSDVALTDLLNDYIMLNQSVSLSVSKDRR